MNANTNTHTRDTPRSCDHPGVKKIFGKVKKFILRRSENSKDTDTTSTSLGVSSKLADLESQRRHSIQSITYPVLPLGSVVTASSRRATLSVDTKKAKPSDIPRLVIITPGGHRKQPTAKAFLANSGRRAKAYGRFDSSHPNRIPHPPPSPELMTPPPQGVRLPNLCPDARFADFVEYLQYCSRVRGYSVPYIDARTFLGMPSVALLKSGVLVNDDGLQHINPGLICQIWQVKSLDAARRFPRVFHEEMTYRRDRNSEREVGKAKKSAYLQQHRPDVLRRDQRQSQTIP